VHSINTRAKRASSILGPVVLGTALVMVTILMLLALPADELSAQGPDEGYVIVQFDENNLTGRHIDFTAPISGLKALELTGLEVITRDFGWGIGVCSIGGVGCPESNCFCDPNNFWNYFYWDGGMWQSYSVGADSSVITDGAVEGWRWGPWGVSMPPAPPIIAATDGLAWLRPVQSATDGGYGTDGATAETLMAVAANDYTASEWHQPGGPSLMGYFLANGVAAAGKGAGTAGKMAVALAAGGTCWPRGAMEPMDYYHPGTGAYSSTNPFDTGAGSHAWGMLGTAALSQTVPGLALDYLKGLQQPDGGWEWDIGWGSDINSTALAIQALVAAGEPAISPIVINGLNYLEGAQNDDGGFPYSPTSLWGTDSDTNSTAYVVQALLAAEDSPTGTRWLTYTNGITPTNPISFLLSMQLADGSFEWQPGAGGDRQASTRQAIPALLSRPFPLKVVELDNCRVYYLPIMRKSSP
jgi:hypothetical protein